MKKGKIVTMTVKIGAGSPNWRMKVFLFFVDNEHELHQPVEVLRNFIRRIERLKVAFVFLVDALPC